MIRAVISLVEEIVNKRLTKQNSHYFTHIDTTPLWQDSYFVTHNACHTNFHNCSGTYLSEIKWVERAVLSLLECHHLEIHSPRWRILVADSVVQITDSIVRIRGGNTV